MPYEELVYWKQYFEKQPYGWREDLRAANIMRTFGDTRHPKEMYPSLRVIFSQVSTERPDKGLKSSFLFNQMLGAVGGDKLAILESL